MTTYFTEVKRMNNNKPTAIENWQRRRGRDSLWHSAENCSIRAAAIGEARSPTVDRRVRRTGSDDV